MVKYVNPWAICARMRNRALASRKSWTEAKRERCVKKVKARARHYGLKVTSKPVGRGGRLIR